VPLQQQQQPQQVMQISSSSSSAAELEQFCFASGTFPVYDVLRGRHTGSVELRVTLAEQQQQQQPDDGYTAETALAADDEQAAEAVDAAAVVAVRHVIEVTVHSASHLPDAQQLQAGGHQLPESRFMRYCFPGERLSCWRSNCAATLAAICFWQH
jgi:hypothetical protein